MDIAAESRMPNIERFALVNAVAKRCAQLHEGAPPTIIENDEPHPMRTAMREIAARTVRIRR